ncbi:MAG: hypothetical protein WCQ77_02725 [Planctomycetota bacterium]
MHLRLPIRRITIWLAIVGYTLVASGIPLPLAGSASQSADSAAAKRLAGKDRSRPFPCMDKTCGCATAEQCFTSCCCNPPAQARACAKAQTQTQTTKPADASCCSHKLEPQTAAADQAAPDLPEPIRNRSVSLRAALACGGIVAEWFAAAVALPPSSVNFSVAITMVDRREPVDDLIESVRVAPESPPPRGA